jgi:hypothetical protein
MVTLAVLALAAAGMSRWAMIDRDVPLDTVLRNLEQRVRSNPKDAQGHYLLGRIHSMAYASGQKTVRIIPPERRSEKDKDQIFPGYTSIRVPVDKNAPMTPARMRHLRRSIEEYTKASRLDPKNPLYALGLGWMYEMATPISSMTDTHKKAAEAYRKVVRLRGQYERNKPTYGVQPDDRLAREAALGLTRLLAGNRDRASVKEYRRMKALADELGKKPSPITPIVVPLQGETQLASLLAPRQTSRFDLAGDGLKREWPWVRPTTGILVWDPLDTGKITSGRQLFGSSTWWMFFRDGYEALATLDSDRSGWLEGTELSGIRVWQDANGNGISDLGEVKPLSAHGIAALNTRPFHRDGNGPRAEQGLRWTNGNLAPTFDWVPTSLRAFK